MGCYCSEAPLCRGEGNPYPDDDAHHQKGEGTINNMDITTQNLDTTAAVAAI